MTNQLLAELEGLQQAKDDLQKDYQEAADKINNMKLDIDQSQEIIIELQQKIDKANEILSNILVVKRSDGNYGPVKNTRKREVYEAICMLNEILDTSSYERNEMLKILGGKE